MLLPAVACWSWPHHHLFPTPHSMHPIRSLKSTLREVVPSWKHALCCKSRLDPSPDSWLLTFTGTSLVVGLLCKADVRGSMSVAVRLWKQLKQSCVRCQGSLRMWESLSAIPKLRTEQQPPEWGLGSFFPFYVCVYKSFFFLTENLASILFIYLFTSLFGCIRSWLWHVGCYLAVFLFSNCSPQAQSVQA